MAFSLGGLGATAFQWLLSPVIWIVIIIFFLFATIGALYIKKKRKLVYKCVEIVRLGSSDTFKSGYNNLKCGWYGKKKYLRGLWCTGEEQLETSDGRVILDFSSDYFQEIDGERGVVCYRHPSDQNILVPVRSSSIDGEKFVHEIPPSAYREAVIDIIKDSIEETKDWKEKLMTWIVIGGVIIFALVSIIVITQMVKNGQSEASKLITEAGKTCLTNAEEVCRAVWATASKASVAP